MKTTTDHSQRVKQIIVEQLGVDAEAVTQTANFREDLGADSLDRVEMLMAMEEAFDLEISDADAEKIETVQQCVDYVNQHAK